MDEPELPEGNADLTACPNCGSGSIVCMLTHMFDICLDCHKIWERIEVGQHFTRDNEMMAFTIPCNNCAFRGKSTERSNPARWEELQETLAEGGRFFCHKGVPLDLKHAVAKKGALAFEFPKINKTVKVAGETHPYETWDTARMRLCRGYLNAHIAPILRRAIHHQGELDADV